MSMKGSRLPILERFWLRVNKDGPIPAHKPELGPCWVWTGATTYQGYGKMNIRGVRNFTHRISWEIHNGPVPDGLWVLHKCDFTTCCRPDHLFVGTNQDNTADSTTKGRRASGERHGTHTKPETLKRGDEHWTNRMPEKVKGESNGFSKLTDDEVRAIRKAYKGDEYTNRESQQSIADRFGIHQTAVSAIVRRQTWTHVE